MPKIKSAYDKIMEEKSLMRALVLGILFKAGDVPCGEY